MSRLSIIWAWRIFARTQSLGRPELPTNTRKRFHNKYKCPNGLVLVTKQKKKEIWSCLLFTGATDANVPVLSFIWRYKAYSTRMLQPGSHSVLNSILFNRHNHTAALQKYVKSSYKFLTDEMKNVSLLSKLVVMVATNS